MKGFRSAATWSAVLLAQATLARAGLLDLLSSIGVAAPITHPLLETVESELQGEGLIDGTLGALEGLLGGEQTFDYVVVGGGTAGAAIGTRLAEAGHSVAIIEAGGYYEIEKPVFGTTPAGSYLGIGASILDTVPTTDWAFLTEPQEFLNDRKFHYARGKCLGGSSALNFMVYHRGTTESYQKWADTVDDESYTLENLKPYFNKAVTFTPPGERSKSNVTTNYDPSAFSSSGGGPVQVGYSQWVTAFGTYLTKAFRSLGLKETTGFDSGDLLGYHYSQSTLRTSDQTRSSSVAYIHAANGSTTTSKNLKVFTQTQARKVLFDTSSGRPKATGVEVAGLLDLIKYKIHARHEVILSAGTFQSPQLLMLSGIGPSDTLEEFDIPQIVNAPGVGQNMWDHVLFGPSYSVKFPTVGSVIVRPLELAAALLQYITSASGPLTYIADVLGWEKLSALPEYRANLSSSALDSLSQFPADWPELEHIGADAYAGTWRFPVLQQPLDGKHYVTLLGALVAPLSRGNVTLKSSNPLVPPAINPNWLSHPTDRELVIAGYRRQREIFRTQAISSQLEEIHPGGEAYPGLEVESDEEILAAVRESLMTVWHAASTCRMGKSVVGEDGVPERVDEMDVVDSRARVFGVDGLRVVDASAFPFLPPGHPQSTIYALAEKIAEDVVKGRD
ncbi:hypothetical protein WHR41_05622 [Cladosporium halotolerans]|uniref:Glucose-methanol-choline oxidoreductase N-terminal domain-containing protein n=1 Tax=Cladosporium halotolerans TaxID=1052096 RepID=A0AB34KKA3_9PEZI